MDQQALPTPRDKLLNLQILRFIAAFGVLASHAAALTLPRGSWFWLFPWTAGVDVFFVISGMIMTIVTAGRFGKSRRRARLPPPPDHSHRANLLAVHLGDDRDHSPVPGTGPL